MLEISHRKAQSLLQSAADDLLSAEDQTLLDAHLAGCAECRAYAKNVLNLENSLRAATHTIWDNQKPKLDYQAIVSPPTTKLVWNSVLNFSQGVGKYAIIAALIIGYFLISNLNGSQGTTSGTETAMLVPTPNSFISDSAASPTPSIQLALTNLQTQACQSIIHIVEPSETLEGIALQYGVPKEMVMIYNNMVSEQLSPGMNLSIPLCENTPSRTALTPLNTMTVTPLGNMLHPTQPE